MEAAAGSNAESLPRSAVAAMAVVSDEKIRRLDNQNASQVAAVSDVRILRFQRVKTRPDQIDRPTDPVNDARILDRIRPTDNCPVFLTVLGSARRPFRPPETTTIPDAGLDSHRIRPSGRR